MIPFTDRERTALVLAFRRGSRTTAAESKCSLD